MEELAKHGVMFPPEILGLLEEQVEELKLVDEWGEKCIPSGGFTFNKDPVGRRNGRQPSEKMQEVIAKTVAEAKSSVSKVPTFYWGFKRALKHVHIGLASLVFGLQSRWYAYKKLSFAVLSLVLIYYLI